MEDSNNKNIVLIGMMGAGKTYIGEKLAKLLVQFSYVDTDKEIEKEQGMSISEIFENYSEKYFRELESNMVKQIADKKNQIISTGGGIFENPENERALKENGFVFYLKATPQELFKRVKNQTNRPLLDNLLSVEPIKNILKKREKNYLKADFVIETNQKQAYTILNDILKEYENNA